MDTRVAAIVVGLLAASWPALARQANVHKPVAPAAHKLAHKAAVIKPAAKKTKKTAKKIAAAVATAYAAMPEAQRLAIESDLAWVGDYQGAAGGDFDERVIDAIKVFQKGNGGKESGILSEQERALLAAAAKAPEEAVGWRLIDDAAAGARIGLPEKLVAQTSASRTGSRWRSGHGQIQIETFRLYEAALPALFDEEKKTPLQRRVESSALKPGSFIISGMQGLKKFLVRAEASGGEVRGITILYDQATAGIMAPVAVAMANAFQGFPDPNAGPPPGGTRSVEYGTAIVVDRSGDLLALRQVTDGCAAITVPGLGHAARLVADKTNDLALIRLYGARNLVPAPLAGEAGKGDDLTLIGIADPLAQDGGDAVTAAAARLTAQGVEPAPKLGFSGAAAIDAQGRFAGIVDLKSVVVAAVAAIAALGPATRQATLVPAAVVRAFLATHGITPAASHSAIDQSIVRVICVRK
jgi:Putative peptidoglycan binding domain